MRITEEPEMDPCRPCAENGVKSVADSPVPGICQDCYEQGRPWALQCRVSESGIIDTTGSEPEPWERVLDAQAAGELEIMDETHDLAGWGPYAIRRTGEQYGVRVHWMVEA